MNRPTAAKLIHNCWDRNQQSVLGQFSIGRVGQFSISANIHSSKYFQRPQEMHHHLAEAGGYKPLQCMNDECGKDIISKERIPYSLAGFYIDNENSIHFLYGCKSCVADYCTHPYWAEIGQIRYIEQMLGWRSVVDEVAVQNKPSADFYKHWALLQEAILQIQVPQGWGRWI
ncbi:hypothetical protein HG619_19395 [Pseudomonas syringae]|nr:hypothetical protein [Pseudomonas syringae]